MQAYGEPSEEVYGTTIHELAHAAHRVLDQGSYDNLVMDGWISPCVSPGDDCNNPGPTGRNNRRLLETWASTVEIMFALKRYRDSYNQPNYEYEKINNISNTGNKQGYTIGFENFYTSAGYDMIDNFNQSYHFGSAYPTDHVNGYSIKQLENALVSARSWWQWRDNINHHYNNPTEQFLVELFNNWTN